MEIRRFLRLSEHIFANVCESGESVPKKEEPVLNFLNFADLAQYEEKFACDGLMVVDDIQDVERDDCHRYGKNNKLNVLHWAHRTEGVII